MKRNLCRLAALLLALLLTVSLVACGQTPEPDDNSVSVSDVSTTTTAEDTTTEGDTTTTTTAEVPSDDTTIAEAEDNGTATKKPSASTGGKNSTTKAASADKTTTTKVTTPTPGPDAIRPMTTTTKSTTKATATTATATTKSTKKTVTAKTSSTVSTASTYPTTSTKKTSAATTTSKNTDPKKSIRILAVGNSFSVDAMNNHLFDVLESLGYNDITLGNLYVAGCSIDTHWSNVSGKKKEYAYYKTNRYGVWSTTYGQAADAAFDGTEWDVITVQQASPDSGRASTFGNLSKLVGWLQDKCPDATILYHMTWAYQKDSTHWAFPAYYGSDQERMYNAIVSATRDTAAKTAGIAGVIPAGTAIQNLRTSSLGDTLTSDGHHLSDSYGDYTAAVTWACRITGEDAQKVTYRPDEIADHFDEIAEAVNKALATPYAVTPCT